MRSSERAAISSRRRPSWMPPPLVFPIVWTTMAGLRTASSVIVFNAVGGTLLAPPLVLFMLHLCVGDSWNTINNVEQRLGVAVPGVFCVLASACAATVAYASVSPLAGRVLAPLPVWLCVAAALVTDIWRLNNTEGQYPLYPTKA
jgi:tryptophan-rich sensory protein